MKKKYFCLGILILFTVFIGGCGDGNFFDIQSIMKPPQLSEDEELIKSVIDRKLGKDFILKYPQRGDYRSAIVLHNFDSEEKNEAVIFYQLGDEKNAIHIMIMQKINGSWNIAGDYLEYGNDVDKVCFGDLNSDGRDEIIVGLADSDTNLNNLAVYEVEKDGMNEIKLDDKYIEFSCLEKNGLFIICPSSANDSFYTKLIKIKNKKFSESSAIKFGETITKCNSLVYGGITDKENGIFLDYTNLDGKIKTEIIRVSGKLSGNTNKIYNLGSSKRDIPILCKDINNDGIIEVPVISTVEDVAGAEKKCNTNMINWSYYDLENEKFKSIEKSVCNYEMGYNFFVPDNWDKNIICSIDEKYQSEKFYEQHIDTTVNKDVGDMLLEIKKISLYEWKSINDKENYVFLGENNGFVYLATIPKKENELIISGDDLKKNFEIINKL